MELLSLDSKTTNSGINNHQNTVQATFWPFFAVLCLSVERISRDTMKEMGFMWPFAVTF